MTTGYTCEDAHRPRGLWKYVVCGRETGNTHTTYQKATLVRTHSPTKRKKHHRPLQGRFCRTGRRETAGIHRVAPAEAARPGEKKEEDPYPSWTGENTRLEMPSNPRTWKCLTADCSEAAAPLGTTLRSLRPSAPHLVTRRIVPRARTESRVHESPGL